MSSIVVANPPAIEPVTLTELKTFLKVDADLTADDDLITGLGIAGREYAETFTNRALISTDFIQYLDMFPYYNYAGMNNVYSNSGQSGRYLSAEWNQSQMIKLMKARCIAVDHIEYPDAALVTQTLLPFDAQANPKGFYVDLASDLARLFPAPGTSWPIAQTFIPNAVAIFFTAGYGTAAANVPFTAKVAIKQFAAHWYEHRESVTAENLKEAPQAVDMLLWSIRCKDFAPTPG